MAHEKIVTAFTQPQQAQVAKEKLIAEGVSGDDIDIISGDRLRVEDKEIRHPSFWQRLFGDDVDDDYAAEYNKAIQVGGVLLIARVDKDDADRVEALLDSCASDYASSSSYASDNRVGDDIYGKNFSGETDDIGSRTVGQDLTDPALRNEDVSLRDEDVRDDEVVAKTLPGDADYVSGRTASEDIAGRRTEPEDIQANPAYGEGDNRETLKLAEEQIDVGKRRVSDGKVRLRRYTVEDEVAEDISLTEQHADVFRSAISEPAYLNDVDWSEKTLEVEESHEVPTVNKTAHVREEVGLRTETTERTETVKDTVRRQEVEVDKNDLESDLNKTKFPPKE
ncbi:YsnF/AvaK domain-containing protein [Enterobacteriaceae bacterium H20N1]|uniref:YsnF/AvaK domain-containing protein n=1 Tax=Dryocola boscaweniae TaxID=2925397 RepID=A0A9X3AB84_9ENTR|nr:YsnF/AvaK domain-containing protein [Dryocola boscaweniae]MCT4700563.1 YsnF/AvaK domain-containing protein [Dryocola boscaweniae]MCT4717719.1 YsnF/AvaK domain-containing protein [Dryocola boscaweniae]